MCEASTRFKNSTVADAIRVNKIYVKWYVICKKYQYATLEQQGSTQKILEIELIA